jgi:hypothetical protein
MRATLTLVGSSVYAAVVFALSAAYAVYGYGVGGAGGVVFVTFLFVDPRTRISRCARNARLTMKMKLSIASTILAESAAVRRLQIHVGEPPRFCRIRILRLFLRRGW